MEASGQLHVPIVFPTETETLYPLDKRLGGPYFRSIRYADVKVTGPTGSRNQNPRSSSQQSVVMPTAPHGLPLSLSISLYKSYPLTGLGDLYGCEMLRIPLCLDNWLTVNCEILAT
jgi:hypothetical protein